MKQDAPEKTGKPARRPFLARRDLLVLGAILAAALALWLVLRGGAVPGARAVATVSQQDGIQQEVIILLDENRVVELEGALPVQLEVQDGAIRFIHSVCPDHDCEGFGWLRREGDWAACLPARVTVRIQTGET